MVNLIRMSLCVMSEMWISSAFTPIFTLLPHHHLLLPHHLVQLLSHGMVSHTQLQLHQGIIGGGGVAGFK